MSLALKQALCSEIVKSHPETHLGEQAWKIDRLAKDNYSSFKQTWFTNKSEEKRAGKRKIKFEGDTTDGDSVPEREQTESVAKRAKHRESPSSECLAGMVDPSSMDDGIQVEDSSTSITTFSSIIETIGTVTSPNVKTINSVQVVSTSVEDISSVASPSISSVTSASVEDINSHEDEVLSDLAVASDTLTLDVPAPLSPPVSLETDILEDSLGLISLAIAAETATSPLSPTPISTASEYLFIHIKNPS